MAPAAMPLLIQGLQDVQDLPRRLAALPRGACDPRAPATMMSPSRARRMPLSSLLIVGLILLAVALAGCAAGAPATSSPTARRPAAAAVTITKDSFHGWEALVLRNSTTEATVVPAIGRLMQLAFVEGFVDGSVVGGRARGPFWSHPGIGPHLPPDENGWVNIGGDKAWPAPQSRWEAIAGKGWPPPKTFDDSPFAARRVGDAGNEVELLSAVDPAYGLRVRRTIALDPAAPILTVETCYEKVAGGPVRAGVWTITQLVSPERLFMRLPARSAFPGGFAQRLPDRPKDLRIAGRLLSLARDPAAKTMLGSDGDALLWVGDGPDLLIETVAETHDPTDEWPDGAHAQIYTSSDEALPYVELELFSPLRDLRIGQRVCLRVRYTLEARATADATAEAKRVLGL
jgi:hypothetical protein